MLKQSYPARIEFTVLIDKELLGRINHLSYRIKEIEDEKVRNDKSFSNEFVSGRFRFIDLNYNLIYKLCGLDRFSTILTDGDRVFAKDSNGLQDVNFKIELSSYSPECTAELIPIEDKGIFSIPYSIVGVKLMNINDVLTIGRQYNFTAKNVLFMTEHKFLSLR